MTVAVKKANVFPVQYLNSSDAPFVNQRQLRITLLPVTHNTRTTTTTVSIGSVRPSKRVFRVSINRYDYTFTSYGVLRNKNRTLEYMNYKLVKKVFRLGNSLWRWKYDKDLKSFCLYHKTIPDLDLHVDAHMLSTCTLAELKERAVSACRFRRKQFENDFKEHFSQLQSLLGKNSSEVREFIENELPIRYQHSLQAGNCSTGTAGFVSLLGKSEIEFVTLAEIKTLLKKRGIRFEEYHYRNRIQASVAEALKTYLADISIGYCNI